MKSPATINQQMISLIVSTSQCGSDGSPAGLQPELTVDLGVQCVLTVSLGD